MSEVVLYEDEGIVKNLFCGQFLTGKCGSFYEYRPESVTVNKQCYSDGTSIH